PGWTRAGTPGSGAPPRRRPAARRCSRAPPASGGIHGSGCATTESGRAPSTRCAAAGPTRGGSRYARRRTPPRRSRPPARAQRALPRPGWMRDVSWRPTGDPRRLRRRPDRRAAASRVVLPAGSSYRQLSPPTRARLVLVQGPLVPARSAPDPPHSAHPGPGGAQVLTRQHDPLGHRGLGRLAPRARVVGLLVAHVAVHLQHPGVVGEHVLRDR